MVFSGLVTAWRLAGCPTRRSPSSVKATIEGVVRMPSAFSMTFGVEPSITATQELVVPRSMPMTLPMILPLFTAGRLARPLRHHVQPPDLQFSAAPSGVLAHIGGPAFTASRRFTIPRVGGNARQPDVNGLCAT